jgi:TolB-like protein/tetratricopeptide (TPR) repeat protein/predicted Ser/Thr protein kinase
MPLTAGEMLGPYEIRSRIAAGGMGEIYSAFDTRLRRSVAVKIVGDAVTSAAERARLEREAQAVAALSHPNILSVFDVGTKDGVFYIVTELLEGRTLRDELRHGPLPLAKALEYAREAAVALRSAHAKGIVHRDIKPENLFITSDGRLKVLDFGLARLLPMPEEVTAVHEPRLTAPEVVVGTVGYMSPEQLRGDAVDQRSDIFSLGCVLFEMLGGRPPFLRKSQTATAAAILNESPDYASLSSVPPHVLTIVRGCLAKNASERYASAEALVADLQVALRGAPTRRNSMVLTMASAAVLVIIAIAVVMFVARRTEVPRIPAPLPGPRHATLAVLPFQSLGADASQEYFSDGLTEDTTTEFGRISPDRLAVIARTSTMRYKKGPLDVRTVGRELGADYVVEGSVRRDGERVRVAAQLVRASDGTEMWAETYDRTVKDIFALQSELARDVASAVQIKVVPARSTPREKQIPRTPEGRDAFLRGRYHLELGTGDDLRKAVEYLSQAVAAEPDSPLANTELAQALITIATRDEAPRIVIPRARPYVDKALQLDGSIAEAHELLGEILLEYDWNWPEAERELKKAIALDPNQARAYTEYATLLICSGRFDEGLQYATRGAALDPVGTARGRNALYLLYVVHRLDDMFDQAQRALDLSPQYGYAYAIRGLAHLGRGEREAALRDADKVAALTDAPFSLSLAAYVNARAGRPDVARNQIHELEKIAEKQFVCFFNVAAIYGALGATDKAFQSLERAFADRSG